LTVGLKLLYSVGTTNLIVNWKERESRHLGAKYTELKLLQKQQLRLTKKICMFRGLLEFFQEDFQFQELSATSKLKDLVMVEILM